jgi:release factor glutamine methyltransferase
MALRPSQVVGRAAGYLERHGVESPTSTAELLLASVLGTNRAGVYGRSDGLTPQEAKLFGRALCLRCAGTPVQHLTGEQGFRRILLRVRPGVFVPRPETEIVVEAALEAIDLSDPVSPVVVDIGTGTGAIALSLKDERPRARVLATDVSPQAVALARENSSELGLDVEFLEGDLLEPMPDDLRGQLEVVVSNPPYVAPEHAANLPAEVRADPDLALFARIDLYDRLFQQAYSWLRRGGRVVVEIAETQGGLVSAAARSAGFTDVVVRPDLTGRDRVVTGRHR